MAMVLQANPMTSVDSGKIAMDTYEPRHHNSRSSSTSSTPPRSASPTNTHDDSFRRMIFAKVEKGKCDRDPAQCQQILEDLMKILKHLTTDVNDYNLAFRETRPSFYMQVSFIMKKRKEKTKLNHTLLLINHLFKKKGIPTFN